MSTREVLRWMAIQVCLALGVAVAAVSCLPKEDLGKTVPAAERATCALLRVLTPDGAIQEICATADDLAPFISDLLAARDEASKKGEVVEPLRVAAAVTLPPPKKRVAQRHCVKWEPVAAPKQGGADAAPDR